MFKLKYANKCERQIGGKCGYISIWRTGFDVGEPLSNIVSNMFSWLPDVFPLIYWLVLTLAITGLLNSTWEFARTYHGHRSLSTFRKRQYKVISYSYRRNARLLTSLFSMNVWLSLLTGIVLVKPSLISFWLMVNYLVITTDFLSWIFEILVNETELSFLTFVYQMFYFASILMARYVRDTLQAALDSHDTADLQLLQSIYF